MPHATRRRRSPVSSRRRRRAVVGAVQRQVAPLPEGRYWYDAIGVEGRTAFLEWRSKYKDSVRVLATQEDAGPPVNSWFLFVVDRPVPFDPKGFPTIATPDVRSRGDTAQRPPPETGPDFSLFDRPLEAASERLFSLALWLGLGYVAIQALTKSEPDTHED